MVQCVKDPALSLQWLGLLVLSLAWELMHAAGMTSSLPSAKKKKKEKEQWYEDII